VFYCCFIMIWCIILILVSDIPIMIEYLMSMYCIIYPIILFNVYWWLVIVIFFFAFIFTRYRKWKGFLFYNIANLFLLSYSNIYEICSTCLWYYIIRHHVTVCIFFIYLFLRVNDFTVLINFYLFFDIFM